MGKRKKSSRKPGANKAKREPLDTTFTCLFCNHEKSVTCKMDTNQNVGNLSCKVCGQTHQCVINYLSAPIDVYSDWIDACDDVQKEFSTRQRQSGRGRGDDDDDDEDLPEVPASRAPHDYDDEDEE